MKKFLGLWPALAALGVVAAGLLACSSASQLIPSSATPTPGHGPGSFDLPDPAVGLAQLESYRLTLRLAFEGTRAGQPLTSTTTFTRTFLRSPESQLTLLEASDPLTTTQTVFGQIGEAHYLQPAPDQPCGVTWGEGEAEGAPATNLAALLPPVLGAEAAGEETINGVPATHYTFDERALDLMGIAQATGEVWVAQAGGWVVKYHLQVKGQADYFGSGMEGGRTWDYELSAVNSLTTIDLPPPCLPVLDDVPTLPEATDLTRLPSFVSYSTSGTLDSVVVFYTGEMKKLNWRLLLNTRPDASQAALLFADQAGRRAFISAQTQGTTVRVTAQVFPASPTATPNPE